MKPPKIRIGAHEFDFGDIMPLRGLLVGGQGSGKTALLKKLRKDLVTAGVVIFDLDNALELLDWYNEKASIGTPVHCVSTMYTDGVGIDWASMLTTPSARLLFAKKMVPEIKNEASPFFTTMVQINLENCVETLHVLAPGKATLADIVRVCCNFKLHSLLSLQAGLGDPWAPFAFNDARKDTEVTVISKLSGLRVFAALDYHTTMRVKLPIDNGVFIMEWNDEHAPALEKIYPFILDRVASIYLAQQSLMHRAFIVDEFRTLQPMQFIEALGLRARKSGCSMILTLHEVSGAYDRYGKDRAEELLGMMDYKIFLKLGSPTTAEWASKYLGSTEFIEWLSDNQRSIKMRPNVLPDELRHCLKKASYSKDKIEGYYDFPDESGPFECKFRDDVILSRPAKVRTLRPESDQVLPRLTRKDFGRLEIHATNEMIEALK